KDVEKALKNGDLDKKIREYTRSEVLICPDDDLMKAFDFMIDMDIHTLAVVDNIQTKRMVGILSKTDVLRALRLNVMQKGQSLIEEDNQKT
ncbi:MAG: CBS domain-containing protein, partial [Candidatus Helarchaeota archaeon]